MRNLLHIILSFLFSTIWLHGVANNYAEQLDSLKEEAKGYLYSDPAKAYKLFHDMEKQSIELFEKKLIDKNKFEESQGDVNSGKGNYHLIATGKVDSAFYFYDQSIQHYKNAKDLKGIGSIYNNKGVVLEQLGEQDSALNSYDSALYYYQLKEDLKSCAKTYGNIGNIYIDKGNYPVAQSYYLKCYENALKIDDSLELAYSYFGLGNIATYTKNYTESEEYFRKALNEFKKTDDLYGLSSAYFSIANTYKHQLKVDSAYLMYNHTLSTFKKSGYVTSLPLCHINIAVLFNEYYDSVTNFKTAFKNEKAKTLVSMIQSSGLDSALFHAQEAIRISKETSKQYTLVYGYIAKGTTHYLLHDYPTAIEYSDSAEVFINKGEYVSESKQLAHLRYTCYKALNRPAEALKWYESYVNIKDSLYNLNKAEELIQQKYQFDFDVKTAQDSVKQAEEIKVKNAEIEVEKAENAKRKTQNIYLILIAFVLLVMGIIIFQRLKITQKQKKIIDHQKQEVESQKDKIELQHLELEETHKEISDSIRYAQRLQHAILPEMKNLKSILKESFVLFKPKDVVSGDFYWMQEVSNGVLIAAADCTGHGVPGAMVSVVCSNALNRAVKEFGLSAPSDILNKTRDLVIETFENTSTDVKDGMDIALCKINYNDSGATVCFSGANNPLWILRGNGTEIEEIKGAKQPIGKYENHTPFPQHEVSLKTNDSIFIFSDGFADQFGGNKGKKMKLKPFKNVLVEMNNLTMDDRKDKLLQLFNNWKGDFEQVDDVTVIGIKI